MDTTYIKEIVNLVDNVIDILEKKDVIRSFKIDSRRVPTQASSDFLIHKEQGDFAERIVFEALNAETSDYSALKYGRNDGISAGDDGFKDFYKDYQKELGAIGKKPDLLIVPKLSLSKEELDISGMSDDLQEDFLKRTIAGLEIRSSSYRFKAYTEFNQEVRRKKRIELKKELCCLKRLYENSGLKLSLDLTQPKESDIIKLPKASKALPEEIKSSIRKCRKLKNEVEKTKDSLSFTVKVEDIVSIKRWIQNSGVRHFFVQVMYDEIFMISFKRILQIIASGKDYSVAKDARNQFKSTAKISLCEGKAIGTVAKLPYLEGKCRLLPNGRVIYLIGFMGGKANIDTLEVTNVIHSDSQY
ncbi:MAG TPA: AccI family restriction endonuclease [Saccharofermentans sp.]|nr:AccI family restriction endonuclease [Saccharofermentans sp.]